MVFNGYNFRRKARCFAGDVGSVSIAFILIFLLGKLILSSGNMMYLFFLTLYGVDSVLTIIHRIYLKENIFDAHRKHFYQVLANEGGVSQLKVSLGYTLVQFLINVLIVLLVERLALGPMVLVMIGLLIGLTGVYVGVKRRYGGCYNHVTRSGLLKSFHTHGVFWFSMLKALYDCRDVRIVDVRIIKKTIPKNPVGMKGL